MYLQIQEPSLWIKSKLTNIILSHRGGIGNRKEKPMDTKVKIISMDEIQAEEIKWLWKPYIPFGKLTIVQGDPGEGKTTFIGSDISMLSSNHLSCAWLHSYHKAKGLMTAWRYQSR